MAVRQWGTLATLVGLLLLLPQAAHGAFTCAAPGGDPATCAALGDLYAATSGASWAVRTGWSAAAAATPTSYCTFAGVTCSGSVVEGLQLPANGLDGTLPVSLGSLTSVTTLDVASNALRGTIGAELGRLTGLTYLNMSHNALTGTVPPEVAALYVPCDGFNLVSGVGNVVYGCDNEVTGDGNVVRGSFDTVVGNANRLEQGASRDTVVGDANFLTHGARFDTVVGSANSLTHGVTHSNVTGGGNTLTYGVSASVNGSLNTVLSGTRNAHIVGTGNDLERGAAGANITGNRNHATAGARNAQIVGSSNTLYSGADDVRINGDSNTVQHGADGTTIKGSSNTVQDGSSGAVTGSNNNLRAGTHSATVVGSLNMLRNGAARANITGDSNTVQFGAQSVQIAGSKNLVQRGSADVSISGDSNTLQASARGSSVKGSSNSIRDGSTGTVTGSNNQLVSGVRAAVVAGSGNYLANGVRQVNITGDTNTVLSSSVHVEGSLNRVADASTNALLIGNSNTVQTGSRGVSINGMNNVVQQASGQSTVQGSGNTISHGSSGARLQGSGNVVSDGSRTASIVGDDNSVTHGSTTATVRGVANTVTQTQNANVTGSANTLSSVVVSAGGVNVAGSGNTLTSVVAPSVNLARSGATVSGSTASPVVRRRLLALPVMTADLSGNNLQWSCDPAGVAGPPNSAAACAALYQLFRNTGGRAWSASWAALDRWPTRNFCTSELPGLGCSRGGSVVSLLLNSSGLSGTLPASALGNLTTLTALDLSGNAALTGVLPTSLTLVTTLNLASSGICKPLESPLTQSDSPAAPECPRSPPPPPSPPSPPAPPPPPSPNPVYGPLAGFAGGATCPGVDHHFEAAAADSVQGGASVYLDLEGTWSLAAAVATGGAPSAPHTGLPLIGPVTNAASTGDLFSVPHQAWLFRGSNGAVLQPSPQATLGSALGFSIAVWFRVDAVAAANPEGNVLLQLSLAAGPGYTVVLTLLASFDTYSTLSVVAQFAGNGASTTDADYAISSSSDEFGPPDQQPNGGNGAGAAGDWQHAVVTFNGAGLQTGLVWNGKQQDSSPFWEPLDLGHFFGTAAPFGPVLGGAVGFDASAAGATVFAPLVGAVGDVQIYGYELQLASSLALAAALPNLCAPLPAALSPPPMPPAPPGGYSPPPPSPPPRAPRPPVERLVSGILALCLSGASSSQLNETLLEGGMQAYLGVFASQVLFYRAVDGCNASLVSPSRRLLQSSATVSFLTQDLTASLVAAKITPLYGAGSAAARSALLTEFAAVGLPVSGVAPLGTSFVAAAEPPPAFRPPLPPGATPASALAAANAGKHANNGVLVRLRSPGAIVGYALAALVLLFIPVYLVLQCTQAGYERRTCVSVALVFHVADDPAHSPRAGVDAAIAGAGGEADEAARFKAPALAETLAEELEAAVTQHGYSAKRTLLRPLLRAPLLAALGAAAKPDAAFTGDDASALALRHKPTSMRLRLKRSLRTEMHWQGREARQLWRRLKRLFSSSADAGKVFRHAAEPAATVGTSAILVEVTWKFGSRDGASAWRHRMRDEAHLSALEAGLQAVLVAPRDAKLPPLELQPVAAGCTLALLDDEPHARLDKKRGKDEASHAPPADGAHGARTHGLSPAVAARLQEVLRLSLRSLNTSRAISAARRSSLALSPRASGGATMRALFASPRPSAVEEEEEDEREKEGSPVRRVELLAAVSTEVDEPAAAAPDADDEVMEDAAPETDAAL